MESSSSVFLPSRTLAWLQWGHDLAVMESAWTLFDNIGLDRASMGP